jgi:hypothetical protein
VEDRGRIDPDVSRFGKAGSDSAPLDRGGDIGLGDGAEPVRAGSDKERRVAFVHAIEMDPQGQGALEHSERRDAVREAGLEGPLAEAGPIEALAHRDGAVLVPAKRPVPARRLVEQLRANGAGRRAEEAGGDRVGRAEAFGEARRARQARAWPTGRNRQEIEQGGNFGGSEGGREMLGAVCIEPG